MMKLFSLLIFTISFSFLSHADAVGNTPLSGGDKVPFGEICESCDKSSTDGGYLHTSEGSDSKLAQLLSKGGQTPRSLRNANGEKAAD